VEPWYATFRVRGRGRGERAMSEEAELPSPAVTIVSRRASRSAMPERLKVAARDDSSDDEWEPEEAAGASDEEDSDGQDRGQMAARSVVA
jgi:hypothetical protein